MAYAKRLSFEKGVSMGCSPKCIKTASLAGPGGNRVMVSQPGNQKYAPGTPHPQCPGCVADQYREMLEEIRKLKDADSLGPGLAAEWETLQAKTKKVI